MSAPIRILEINDAGGNVIEPDWLLRAEAVHRQLRPHLPADYGEMYLRNGAASPAPWSVAFGASAGSVEFAFSAGSSRSS